MTNEVTQKIKRLNESIGFFNVEVNENISIKELGERFDLEFAKDFQDVLTVIVKFKNKWKNIYRE